LGLKERIICVAHKQARRTIVTDKQHYTAGVEGFLSQTVMEDENLSLPF
jgi:hypothetical protein